MNEEDLSPERIAALHREVMAQGEDLYTFLKKRFPGVPIEDRLKYLATVLNDHFDDYVFETDDELRDEGYVVKRFFPKNDAADR